LFAESLFWRASCLIRVTRRRWTSSMGRRDGVPRRYGEVRVPSFSIENTRVKGTILVAARTRGTDG
jgi:hypothetical protein